MITPLETMLTLLIATCKTLHIPPPNPPEDPLLTRNEDSTVNLKKCQLIQNENMHLTRDKVETQQQGISNPVEKNDYRTQSKKIRHAIPN